MVLGRKYKKDPHIYPIFYLLKEDYMCLRSDGLPRVSDLGFRVPLK